MGLDCAPLTFWAGKPDKLGRRVFAYGADAAGTIHIAKIGRDGDRWLEREWTTIHDLRQTLDGHAIADALPDRIRYEDPILVQRWREGTSLVQILLGARWRIGRPRAVMSLAVVIDWLRDFHRATSGGNGIGVCHGDFKPSNLIVSRGRLAVIDWELSGEGRQEFDFWQLATHVALLYSFSHGSVSIERAFFQPTWIGRTLRSSWARYCGNDTEGALPLDRYAEYVDWALARRASLGLQNDGYFLETVRDVLARRRLAAESAA